MSKHPTLISFKPIQSGETTDSDEVVVPMVNIDLIFVRNGMCYIVCKGLEYHIEVIPYNNIKKALGKLL